MSRISISREHKSNAKQATAEVEKIASRMSEKFGLSYHWEDEVLHFGRSGVNGKISVDDDSVYVDAKLGLMFVPMKSLIQQEVEGQLDKLFG